MFVHSTHTISGAICEIRITFFHLSGAVLDTGSAGDASDSSLAQAQQISLACFI
jgi:hypothetical protein